MEITSVVERVRHIAAVRGGQSVDAVAVESALVAVRELAAWTEAQHAGLVTQLSSLVSFPEATIANAAKTTLAGAAKSKERSDTLVETPRLAGALADGVVTSAHIDAVTRGARQLPDADRATLFERMDSLIDVAEAANVDQYAKRVALEVRRIQRDDGLDRLEHQRRATRLSSWVDAEGMWNLRGRFDPVTGVKLASKLDTAVETLFSAAVPESCPTDPIEKQRFLQAHALLTLVEGAGSGRPGRAEFVVVIDADAEHSSVPAVEWPIPVEIPERVLMELAGEADVCAVVVRNGVVLYAPGVLDLGRTTRLANRAQRRALRGLYRGCAIPGCSVAFDRCELHHVLWWRHGGRTDLDNLIPICTKHHAKVHHDGWIIELGANRELTLRLPDGTVRATGPPGRQAA
jgi:Domain of unknown function (DUF222)/HNH endonuclease